MSLALIAMLVAIASGYATYSILIKVAANAGVHQVVGAVVLQVAAAVVGLIALLFLKANGVQLAANPKGLGIAVLAGVTVGIAEIISFFLFSRGVDAAVANPAIMGGWVVIVTLVGLLVLHEHYRPQDYAATVMIVICIAILVHR